MSTLASWKTSMEVTYNNTVITPKIKSWSFTDNLSGEADDISFSVEDKNHLWMGKWAPDKGETVKATIINQERKTTKYVKGRFEIDEFTVDGPPSETKIKAISVPESSSLRAEGRHKAWEKTNLKKVASDIAKRNKMRLYYDVKDSIDYDRLDQSGESDLKFLMKLCINDGLALKISDKKIIIFDESVYEKKAYKATIKYGDPRIIKYGGKSSLNGTYRSCKVTYQSKNKKKTYHYTFVAPKSGKKGRELVIREDVKSQAAAKRRAKARLRKENKDANTFSLVLKGYLNYYAGMTLKITGFGKFDGKYIITSFSAVKENGLITNLEMRKCLEGY